MEEKNKQQKYISLADAAKLCSYSEPYLRLRARQGKLKSIKLGKKWMTTATWIDDYDARVQEWRRIMDAKKAASSQAVFVAAPEELLEVLAPETAAADAEKEAGDVLAQETPVAVFCEQKDVAKEEPLFVPSPRRQFNLERSGQIFPSPKKEQLPNVAGYGWFGAFLSGVACALLLFLAAGQDILPSAAPGGLGQANISQPVAGGAGETRIAERLLPEKIDYQMPQFTGVVSEESGDSLKELVKIIADFFNKF